jgi:hypothetical protein
VLLVLVRRFLGQPVRCRMWRRVVGESSFDRTKSNHHIVYQDTALTKECIQGELERTMPGILPGMIDDP